MTRQIFADFFRSQYESRPEVSLPAPAGIHGFAEECRADEFQSTVYQPHAWETGPLCSRLSGKLYTIVGHHLSAILALYRDGTILWLDDHSSDSDFAEFVRREDLLSWLPDQFDELVELLIETKLSFLGWPQLIRSAADVRDAPDLVREAVSELGGEWLQNLLESEKRLSDVAARIHPPTCEKSENGEFQLQFYVWTSILGKVIELRCFFGGDSLFRYEGVQLTEYVGFHTVPK